MNHSEGAATTSGGSTPTLAEKLMRDEKFMAEVARLHADGLAGSKIAQQLRRGRWPIANTKSVLAAIAWIVRTGLSRDELH